MNIKDDGAEERDGRGDGDEEQGVEDAVGEDLRGLKDGVGTIDGEEEGAKDSVKGEHAEEESCEFGEFEERALEDFYGW